MTPERCFSPQPKHAAAPTHSARAHAGQAGCRNSCRRSDSMRRSATRRVAASLASGAVGWSVGSACSRSGGALPDADGGEWTPMSHRRHHRRPPLRRRSCDAQRGLLGGGEAARVHFLATAPHPCLKGLERVLASFVELHVGVSRLALSHHQCQPLRLRLLPRLLARQRRWRRCSPLRRYRLPLRRTCDAQRHLLGGCEAAQAHLLATASHLRLVGLRRAGLDGVHAEVACAVVGQEQRQPLRLPLRALFA
eukprot:scaffold24770_cov31-Phaeocystis_antarctica.AAC.2